MATGDNNAHGITEKEIQLYQGSEEQDHVTHQAEGFSSEGLDKVTHDDDVLAPTPISQFRQPQIGHEDIEEQQTSSGRSSKPKKQRILITTKVLGTKDVFFRVFKFPGDEEHYLLEMHQVDTRAVDRYRLKVGKDETKEKWGIKVYDLETGQHVVFPMTEDSSRPKFLKKYQLSLQERLETWTVEKRIRINSRKEETFYRHRSRTFRSFLEVSGFILYSCEPKDLQAIDQEEQPSVEAIMQISSAEARNAHVNVEGATKMEE
ncbi:hypothetical protein Salat_2320000 [Sesamum alatum]|uniref:Uncharacterized protein n=1 Tax=Sesamum alatum TaxID=300844 RepID=A0AAE2CEE5_9LAMI|nr:hypothetical protein Salat_2320000 [Sesamum alatum]